MNLHETAAIINPSEINLNVLANVKKQLLLFDFVGIPFLPKQYYNFRIKHNSNCPHKRALDEILLLNKQGLIIDPLSKEYQSPLSKSTIDSFNQKTSHIANSIEIKDHLKINNTLTELTALLFNGSEKNTNVFAIPIIGSLDTIRPDTNVTKQHIWELILKKMPTPLIETTIEDLISFKLEENNSRRLTKLMVWVDEATHSGFTIQEMSRRINYFISEYEDSLSKHRIQFTEKAFRFLFSMVKKSVSKDVTGMTSSIFDFGSVFIERDLQKSNFAGSQFAYIIDSNQRFDSSECIH